MLILGVLLKYQGKYVYIKKIFRNEKKKSFNIQEKKKDFGELQNCRFITV